MTFIEGSLFSTTSSLVISSFVCSVSTTRSAVSLTFSSSPSSKITAIGLLTLTPSLPSETKSLPIIPSSTASNSIVALSVSISAIRSPLCILSPSLTSHLARVPSSIVGESAGINIFTDTDTLLYR